VEKTFGEQAVVLDNNDMGNSDQARAAAATKLEDIVANHHFGPGEKLNIVTHSHGGNVVAEATHEGLGHKIDNLVTLGVPVRADYSFNESVIGSHLNVYSNHDRVQPEGGQTEVVGSFLYGAEPVLVPAGRTINAPGVKNLDATSQANRHSDLWQSPGTWNKIVSPEIKK